MKVLQHKLYFEKVLQCKSFQKKGVAIQILSWESVKPQILPWESASTQILLGESVTTQIISWESVTTHSLFRVSQHKWAASRQNQHSAIAQSDQDPCCSLINPITSRETDSEQHGSLSDCADAQASLDPCWSQTHYVGFVVTRLKLSLEILSWDSAKKQTFSRQYYNSLSRNCENTNYLLKYSVKIPNILKCWQKIQSFKSTTLTWSKSNSNKYISRPS
jgi:hypothetical protein